MRLRWTEPALADLATLAERAPAQAAAVVRAAEWLAQLQTPGIGRHVAGYGGLYWPVPPQGIAYAVEGPTSSSMPSMTLAAGESRGDCAAPRLLRAVSPRGRCGL